MGVALGSRRDITLEAWERIAWGREHVRVESAVLGRIDAARASFLRLIDRPDVIVYGVTSGYGDRAGDTLDYEERRRQAPAAALRAASFGEPLPERVTRGIVVARLANFLDGHAAVTSTLVENVVALINDREPLPAVPVQGNGGSGEILALAHLFGPLIERSELGEKEGLALINGSPCAAALVADAAIAARRRLALAYDVLAASVEAFRAPLDAYDEALEELWGEHEARAVRRLRERLDETVERRPHQAPVSFRILPRVLGEAERVIDAAAEVAAGSLRAVTDNPTYLPPSHDHPDGRVLSTGGYHDAAAAGALHQLSVCWADLCLLVERHVERHLFSADVSSDVHELARLLQMVAVGYAEEARGAAAPVILPRGGPGQNDVTAPALLAWSREQTAGAALEATLATLAVAACVLLPSGAGKEAVRAVVSETSAAVASLHDGRAIGGHLEDLARVFRQRVLPA